MKLVSREPRAFPEVARKWNENGMNNIATGSSSASRTCRWNDNLGDRNMQRMFGYAPASVHVSNEQDFVHGCTRKHSCRRSGKDVAAG